MRTFEAFQRITTRGVVATLVLTGAGTFVLSRYEGVARSTLAVPPPVSAASTCSGLSTRMDAPAQGHALLHFRNTTSSSCSLVDAPLVSVSVADGAGPSTMAEVGSYVFPVTVAPGAETTLRVAWSTSGPGACLPIARMVVTSGGYSAAFPFSGATECGAVAASSFAAAPRTATTGEPSTCMDSQLGITAAEPLTAAGHTALTVAAMNLSSVPCTIQGYPAMTFHLNEASSAESLTAPGSQVSRSIPGQSDDLSLSPAPAVTTVLLAADGGTAFAAATWATQPPCATTIADQVTLPAEPATPLALPYPITVCGAVLVQPFQS